MSIVDDFTGGSLNDIIALEDHIIKKYTGSINRGSEKLRAEREWLIAVPTNLREKLPLLFPKIIDFKAEPNLNSTELHVSRIPRISLSKAILYGLITPEKARLFLDTSLKVLLNELYPIRNDKIQPIMGYNLYHSKRLALARKYLRRLPYMLPILNAARITVNGISCPSINRFLSWLDSNARRIFVSRTLVAVHGNFHPDNILIDINRDNPSNFDISFVDPRGDLVGYPHYDIAKLLITLEGYYDEIHYERYDIDTKVRGNSYDLNLQINEQMSSHHQNCLLSVIKWIDEFTKSEKVTIPQFLWSVYTAECIHILSFCFYHAYGPNAEPNRIRAFIAIFALLAQRLFDMWASHTPLDIPKVRLSIK